MSQFLGTHHTKLDNKGRTSVPSTFRTALRAGGEQPAALVLRPSHKHSCIDAYPADAFHAFAAPLSEMAMFGDDQDDLTTALYAGAYPVEADKDGRIILPDPLVRHAGLTDAIVFMGLGRHFQIWEPTAADRRLAEAQERARARNLTIPARPAP